MDVTVIATYRCDARCSMCHVWQHPTVPDAEIGLPTLEKIPPGLDNLNITGGEPTLRRDLREIVELLYPKARTLEISTNGLHADRLEPIVRRYPHIKIRFSLETADTRSDQIRGEQGGFEKKVKGLRRLRDLGGVDLGFAAVIQDASADGVVELYRFASAEGFELSTSALHNGFQFHKGDNRPFDRIRVARQIERLIEEMLRTFSVKTWFRAYLNLGLIAKTLGQARLLPCTAATDFVFVDPWSDVYACNVRPDLLMGNLGTGSWHDIVAGRDAGRVREAVLACGQNCWMVTTARAAIRNPAVPGAAHGRAASLGDGEQAARGARHPDSVRPLRGPHTGRKGLGRARPHRSPVPDREAGSAPVIGGSIRAVRTLLQQMSRTRRRLESP